MTHEECTAVEHMLRVLRDMRKNDALKYEHTYIDEAIRQGEQILGIVPPVKPLTLAELRNLISETARRAAQTPGKAVTIPPEVVAEGRKLMAGQPSLYDQLYIGGERVKPLTPEQAEEAAWLQHKHNVLNPISQKAKS